MAESNKQRLASHNERLEQISSEIDDLPEYEDVNPEVEEQEDIIAQIKKTIALKGTATVEFTVSTEDLEDGVSELAKDALYFVTG